MSTCLTFKAADEYIKSGNKEIFCDTVPNINMDTGIANTMLSEIHKRVTLNDFTSIIGKNEDIKNSIKMPFKNTIKMIRDIYNNLSK